MIKGSSGYVPIHEAYNDKLVITPDSIKYEYKPYDETILETNTYRKWSYKTTSPIFNALYKEVVKEVEEIFNHKIEIWAKDVGVIEFIITYEDKNKVSKTVYTTNDTFIDCFRLIKRMVPNCEYIPTVIDY